MVNFFICLIISVLISFGASILLVEKGKDWPIKRYRIILQKLIHDHIHYKAAQVLSCTTCTSFWASFFSDIIVGIIAFFFFGIPYFFWPFSGIICAGITWYSIEYLNAIDKEQNINVFIDNKGEKNEN